MDTTPHSETDFLSVRICRYSDMSCPDFSSVSSSSSESTDLSTTKILSPNTDEKEPPSKAKSYAFVMAVFKNPAYLLGAMITAWSIRQTKTIADIVLMITDDIPSDQVALAGKIFDRICVVPYLRIEAKPLRTEKQRARYSGWMDVSCTKWNALSLTEYKKVIFVDSDKLILTNVDELFNLPTPAGTFSSPQAAGVAKRGMYNPYANLSHGDLVRGQMISEGLDGSKGASFTVIGTMVVLEPSELHFRELVKMLGQYTARNPFGYDNCNSSIDEQILVHFYFRHLSAMTEQSYPWTYVSQRHNWICWHPQWLKPGEKPTVIHYFGLKAWNMKRNDWLDLEPWWTSVISMIGSDKFDTDQRAKLRKMYRESELDSRGAQGCFYCKLFHPIAYMTHPFTSSKGIECPIYQSSK